MSSVSFSTVSSQVQDNTNKVAVYKESTDFLDASTSSAKYGPWLSSALVNGTFETEYDVDHPGILVIKNGASANSGGVILTPAINVLGKGETFTCVFQAPEKTADTRVLRMGFFNVANNNSVTDGCYYGVSNGNGQGVFYRDAGSSYRAYGPLDPTKWYKVVIEINKNRQDITWSVYNGSTLVITESYNSGNALNQVPLYCGIIAWNNGTTAGQKLVKLDYLEVKCTETLTR